MENEELNKKITEWLGLCWHEFTESDERDPVISYCSKCGKPNYEYDLEAKVWEPINQNIEFTSNPKACFEQIVPKLGYMVLQYEDNEYYADVSIGERYAEAYGEKTASMALCLATEKLIDEESPK